MCSSPRSASRCARSSRSPSSRGSATTSPSCRTRGEDRQLDFSRFDIGGVESRSGSELDAFVFTERGIYRPGDEIRIGLIVKQRDWAGQTRRPADRDRRSPTRADDSRAGAQARAAHHGLRRNVATRPRTSRRSGTYTISVYLVRNGKRDLLLGETSVIVKEFLPDRMKIESHLSKETKAGWITPDGCHGGDHAAQSLRHARDRPPHQVAPRPFARRLSLRRIPRLHVLRPAAPGRRRSSRRRRWTSARRRRTTTARRP